MARPLAIVTGGAGFIGSHMVDLLVERGFRVDVVDNLLGGRRENIADHDGDVVRLIEQDIRTLDADQNPFDGARYVFHFAGIGDIVPSIERPGEYVSVNVGGTVAVLECARRAGVERFVYAASSSCYGLASVPTDEQHPIQPEYPYALSKYMGEETVFHWGRVYKLPVNSIRIFNAYGTRARTTGAYGAVFGVFLRQKLAEQPFTVVGDGTQRRDFVYASDVARAFLLAAETQITGEAFNLGGGDPQSVNRIVELLGGKVVHVPKRPGEPDVTWADIGYARSVLGWEPEVSFEDGIGRMLAQIEYWRDAPLWNPSRIAQATETWFKYLG
jgi:UDP-glucose 4-epimerase